VSSGKAHARASLMLAPLTGAGVAIWTRDPAAGACAALGCASGVILSPDLDVDHRTESEEVVWRWGCLFGIVFQWYWYGYGLAIKHQKIWSHLPGLGTVGRVLYAFWWAVPLSFAIRWTPGVLFWWFAWWGFVGLLASDTGHWVMDGFPVKLKVKGR